MKTWLRRIVCLLWGHNWTSLAMQGKGVPNHLKPVSGDSADVIRSKFQRYATMYCESCGTTYKGLS